MNISKEELEKQRKLLKRKQELEKQLSEVQDVASLGLHIKLYRNNIGTTEAREVEIDRIFCGEISDLIISRCKDKIKLIDEILYP